MRTLPKKITAKQLAVKQAKMAAQVLQRESETASRALAMHALYVARYGELPQEYLEAAWNEIVRTSGQRNLSSKEFFEKCYQAARLVLRDLAVKPTIDPTALDPEEVALLEQVAADVEGLGPGKAGFEFKEPSEG